MCSCSTATQQQDGSSSLSSTTTLLMTMAHLPHFTLPSTRHSRCSINGIITISHTWERLLKCHPPCQCPPKMTDPQLRPLFLSWPHVQLIEEVRAARVQTGPTWFQWRKCTVCVCHLGSFPKLILFSQLWNILFFQFQNLLMLKKKGRKEEKSNQPSSGLRNK